MQKKILIAVGVVVALGGWYAFRPERLFIDRSVNETFEAAGPATGMAAAAPMALLAGNFHSVSHESHGVATLYQAADGSRTLRLTDFETSNGPDVRVYLVAAADASDNETVTNAGFIELGALKGNKGDQNYDVPADVDLAKYRAITIWCRRFGVNFATAPLAMAGGDAPATTMAEPMPASGSPVALSTGMFHSNAHDTQGTATIYRLADDSRLLRLTGFETSNGPDVHVYLVAAADVNDNDTVSREGFIDLASLKGNKGDQNYVIPADLDLAKYRTVTIWCKRFGVNFGSAPLTTS